MCCWPFKIYACDFAVSCGSRRGECVGTEHYMFSRRTVHVLLREYFVISIRSENEVVRYNRHITNFVQYPPSLQDPWRVQWNLDTSFNLNFSQCSSRDLILAYYLSQKQGLLESCNSVASSDYSDGCCESTWASIDDVDVMLDSVHCHCKTYLYNKK